ncbi:MAG: IPT/TIG domain-containing protein, partial [Elusimicrobia bacterium]|nr:IPT/TIG domain-containing protein [Elusimicrobiota bacterium]
MRRVSAGNYRWGYTVHSGGATTIQYETANRALATATWYHVAFVRSGTTNSYIFQNGVSQALTLTGSSSASIPDYAGSAYVGSDGLGTNRLNGWIDGLRVSKGLARWTAGFTPPAARYDDDSYSVLLLHMDGVDTSTIFIDDVLTGRAKATQATLATDAIVQSLSFYAHDTGNVRLALYSDSSGPSSKLWESGDVAATAASWNTVLISAGSPTSLTLNSGTYWLAWQWNATSNGPSYTAGSAGSGNYLWQVYGAFPASWSGGTSSTEQWSLYATQAPPTVTSIAAASGDILGGTSVTITGTNFVSGATVLIGGEAATSVAWVDSSHLTATTPAGAAGTADVTVTNPDGQSDTLADAYTYVRNTILCGAPSRDGAVSLTGVVNTYWPGAASAPANAMSITLGASAGAATPISAGDMVLVIQMQDAAIDSSNTSSYGDGVAGDPASGSTSLNRSGMYEYVKALSALGTGGGTLSFQGQGVAGGLMHAYTDAAATSTQGQRQFQAVRVPQYSSATLTSGLTAAAWNGATGGVLAVDVSGVLSLGGATVSLDGLGFRGGGGRQLTGDTGGLSTDYVQSSTKNFNGAKGEGIAGTPGYIYDGSAVATTGTDYPYNGLGITGGTARGAPGNAGGGGTDGELTLNQWNSGGGGGGNGGTGGGG